MHWIVHMRPCKASKYNAHNGSIFEYPNTYTNLFFTWYVSPCSISVVTPHLSILYLQQDIPLAIVLNTRCQLRRFFCDQLVKQLLIPDFHRCSSLESPYHPTLYNHKISTNKSNKINQPSWGLSNHQYSQYSSSMPWMPYSTSKSNQIKNSFQQPNQIWTF